PSCERFRKFATSIEPLARLRYLFPDVWWKGDWRFFWEWWTYERWSGRAEQPLAPFTTGIDFLESFLRGTGELSENDDEFSARERALAALSAMLGPGEARAPESSLAERVVGILARAAREEASLELRFRALKLLSARSCMDPDMVSLDSLERCETFMKRLR